MWGMRKLLATCLLLAALASSSPVNALECKYGIITTGTDRYCAPPPDGGGGGGIASQGGTEDAEMPSTEITYLDVLVDSVWVVVSLL